MKNVIAHYHIFKNSGTSFDKILKLNFHQQFLSFDGPFVFTIIDQKEFLRILARFENVKALSSHHLKLPVPASLKVNVIPVVFVRNPILRIFSVYNYNKINNDNTNLSKNSYENNFNSWVEENLSNPILISEISNIQTRFLSHAYNENVPASINKKDCITFDYNQALRNINNVDLIARTEYFDLDVELFSKKLSRFEIEFKFYKNIHENKSQNINSFSVDEQLANVRQQLSEKNYVKLVNANQQDIKLYDFVSKKIEKNN